MKRNFVQDLIYEDADTGQVLHTVKMRYFQTEQKDNNGASHWVTVRSYVVADEAILNPGFGKPPQLDNAFPNGQQAY